MNCKDCPYKREFQKWGNVTKEVCCKHPDQDYIRKYYETHNIHRFVGFVGFINSKGEFPVKKSPKWCPLKQEKGSIK